MATFFLFRTYLAKKEIPGKATVYNNYKQFCLLSHETQML